MTGAYTNNVMQQDYNNLTLNMEGPPVAMVGWEIGPWCIGIQNPTHLCTADKSHSIP